MRTALITVAAPGHRQGILLALLLLAFGAYPGAAQPRLVEVRPEMLSGSQTFMAPGGERSFAQPIPYGVGNNAED